MENLIKFVRPELLVLIAVLYFIGCAVRKSNVKNTYIPLILGGVGIGLALIWVLAVSPLTTWQEILMAAFTAIVQGILVAGGSVYVNELISQKKKNRPENIEGK